MQKFFILFFLPLFSLCAQQQFPQAGIWKGIGVQEGSQWALVLECSGDAPCKVSYPGLSCEGTWIVEGRASGRGGYYKGQEKIYKQPSIFSSSGCDPLLDLRIWKLNNFLLFVEYKSAANGEKSVAILFGGFYLIRA